MVYSVTDMALDLDYFSGIASWKDYVGSLPLPDKNSLLVDMLTAKYGNVSKGEAHLRVDMRPDFLDTDSLLWCLIANRMRGDGVEKMSWSKIVFYLEPEDNSVLLARFLKDKYGPLKGKKE